MYMQMQTIFERNVSIFLMCFLFTQSFRNDRFRVDRVENPQTTTHTILNLRQHTFMGNYKQIT